MYYAKKVGNKAVRCNLADTVPFEVMVSNPSEEVLANYDVVVVHEADTFPEHDPETHGLAEAEPVFENGKWIATYTVVEKTPEPEMPDPLKMLGQSE